MPRKYRPPARRRSGRRTNVPYAFEPAPEETAIAESPTTVADVEAEEPIVAPASTVQSTRSTAVKHLTRDYSYVRAEVLRIIAFAGFIIVSLVITSILRD